MLSAAPGQQPGSTARHATSGYSHAPWFHLKITNSINSVNDLEVGCFAWNPRAKRKPDIDRIITGEAVDQRPGLHNGGVGGIADAFDLVVARGSVDDSDAVDHGAGSRHSVDKSGGLRRLGGGGGNTEPKPRSYGEGDDGQHAATDCCHCRSLLGTDSPHPADSPASG